MKYRLVTDGQTNGRTDGHTTTAYAALAWHRAVKRDVKEMKHGQCTLHSQLLNNQEIIYAQEFPVFRLFLFSLYFTQCGINVGAIDAAALGPFTKQAHGYRTRKREKSSLFWL